MPRITRRAFIRSSALAAAGTTLLPRPGLAQAKEVPLAPIVALTGTNAAWGQRT